MLFVMRSVSVGNVIRAGEGERGGREGGCGERRAEEGRGRGRTQGWMGVDWRVWGWW